MAAYADLEALKSYLRIPDSDTQDDDELTRDLEAASRAVDHACGQTFTLWVSGTNTTYVLPSWSNREGAYVVDFPTVATTTDFEVFAWDSDDEDFTADITPDPISFAVRPFPINDFGFTRVVLAADAWSPETFGGGDYRNMVAITARFGWPSEYPPTVVEATLIQAARFGKRRDAVFGVVGAPDGSGATRLLNRVDPDVELMLRPYTRLWAAR